MAWKIELDPAAERDLSRLDRTTAQRVLKFLKDRLKEQKNPRTLGLPLQGDRFSGLWRYRVGDYRIIAQIKEAEITVLVIRIAHRREVYR